MAKMTMKQFEQSKFDKEKKGVKEGSPKDRAMDKKQLAAKNAGKPMPFAKGGAVKGKRGC